MTPQAILEGIKVLKVTELAELVKAIEIEFGVSAAAVSMAPAGGGAAAPAAAERTEFKVTLKDAGTEKLKVIKALRAACPELGLKEASDAFSNTPFVIRESAPKEEAEKIKKALEEAGSKIELS